MKVDKNTIQWIKMTYKALLSKLMIVINKVWEDLFRHSFLFSVAKICIFKASFSSSAK